jgi:hypothetical protein
MSLVLWSLVFDQALDQPKTKDQKPKTTCYEFPRQSN